MKGSGGGSGDRGPRRMLCGGGLKFFSVLVRVTVCSPLSYRIAGDAWVL